MQKAVKRDGFFFCLNLSSMTTASFTDPRQEKHRQIIKRVLKTCSNSQQLQLAKKAIVETIEGSQERIALAEKIDRLQPLVDDELKYFFAGGAIRGGKTFVYIALMSALCKIYPKSRWIIIRKSTAVLQKTSIPSTELVLKNSEGLYWKRNDREYFVQFPNGSRIYFMSEGYDSDKNLTKFLGLECNGVLLEQMEELQEKTYVMVKTRLGSWLGVEGPMPPSLLFGTFNPTYGWVKKQIYDPHKIGKLDKHTSFTELLPTDNPFVTDDQFRNWETLPPDEYARLIKGMWDIEVKGQFMNQFSKDRHVAHRDIPLDWKLDIILSFDFNVDPMTCIIGQTNYNNAIFFIGEIRQEDSDTYAMCAAIKPIIAGREHTVKVTGDASGKNRMSGTRGHINQYQIIKEQLGLSWDQFMVPSVNPGIADSRTFCNALLYRLPIILFSPSMEHTIKDMMFTLCSTNKEGDLEIKKTGMNEFLSIDNKHIGHLLDCVRYFLHTTFTDYLEIPKS